MNVVNNIVAFLDNPTLLTSFILNDINIKRGENMVSLEHELLKINELKKDLLLVSKCIDNCNAEEIYFYQDLCLSYSKRLKKLYNTINKEYNTKICCSRCDVSSQ